MGKKSKIDVKLLSLYFNIERLSFAQVKKLTASNDIIKNASKFVFGEVKNSLCYQIVVAIRRDMGGISKMLENVELVKSRSKLNVAEDICEYILGKGVTHEDIKSNEYWNLLFKDICKHFCIKLCVRNSYRIKKIF